MKEKRRTKRVELHIDLYNSTQSEIDAKNVCEHGMCIITNEPHDVGKYFRRSFILPNGAGISIFGKVVWRKIQKTNKYKTGIQFISLGSTDREHLIQYINKEHKKKLK